MPVEFHSRLLSWLYAPEDSSYLAAFRILWAYIMTYEMYLFMEDDFRKVRVSYYMDANGVNLKASLDRYYIGQ